MGTKDSAFTATTTRILSSDFLTGLRPAQSVPDRNARVRPIDIPLTLMYIAATARLIGRKTAGAGAAEELTQADVATFLGMSANGLSLVQAANYAAMLTALSGVATSRSISTTAPLSGGGNLSADRTFSITDFVASGGSHARGTVPDPGATAGTEKVLHEDATWRSPATKKKIALTDASTVAIDASLGDYFTLLTTSGVGATRKLGNVTNPPASGYVKYITIEITQDSSGSRAVTYDTAYKFSTTNPSPTVSTGANLVDRLIFNVDSSGNTHLVGIDLGGS